MANQNVKRVICEDGIVLSKVLKKATEEFKGQDGRVVPAQPERYVAKIASSYKIEDGTGLEEVTILDYKVSEELFKKLKFLQRVEVSYEFSTYACKPMEVKIK